MKKYFLIISILIAITILADHIFSKGKEPEFENITLLPQSENLLVYDAAFSRDLLVKDLFAEQVFSWNIADGICFDGLTWSEKDRFFSFWGFPCQDRFNWSHYKLAPDNTLEVLPTEKPFSPSFEHIWSPDGTTIAYPRTSHTQLPATLTDVVIQTDNQPYFKQITHLKEGSVYDLDWSPDGNSIIFLYRPHSSEQPSALYKVNIQDEKLTLLTTGDGFFSQPQWSTDGNTVAYIRGSDFSNHESLWVIDTDRNKPFALFWPEISKSSLGVSAFAWSPNGNQIAFVSNHDGACKRFKSQNSAGEYITVNRCGYETYLINIDGTELRKISNIISYRPISTLFWINTN